jgi:hypothetical protein
MSRLLSKNCLEYFLDAIGWGLSNGIGGGLPDRGVFQKVTFIV